MAKKLREYIEYISNIDINDSDLDNIKTDLLVKIGFFSHERLIHLYVTLAFAILTMLSLILAVLIKTVAAFLLPALFLVLLIPYIRHYYVLENGVQKLYDEYDRLNAFM